MTPEHDTGDESRAEDETSSATDSGATDDAPLTSLRDIKAKYADGSASTGDDADGSAAEDESTDADAEDAESEDAESADAEPEEQKPKPASSGESHQPRTDAEIGEGGSLFDL